jgi:hypothetical protein
MNFAQQILFFSAAISVTGACAQSVSSSGSYTLLSAPAGALSSGGQVSNGTHVTAQIATGGMVLGGVSNISVNGVQEQPNLIGQLYDVSQVVVSALPATIDEGGTRELSATATMGDGSTLTNPASTTWGFIPPAVTGINAFSRIATAGAVFEDTATVIEADILGVSGGLEVTVLNIDSDNYPGYAGDGIDDDWQVANFSLPPNLLAAPGANPDGDADDNLTEFLAGFDPNDPASFLQLAVLSVSGSTVELKLNKAIPGRVYRLMETDDLNLPFTELENFTVSGEELSKILEDNDAPAGANFYRLEIEKP